MVGERTEACGERKKRERRKVEKKGGEEIKEKRNIGKSGGERERSRAGRERHVEKVVPLLFFSFSRTHRRSLNPIPLILKQTNTYRMYHGGKWTKGSWDGLGSKEGRRVEREREKKKYKVSAHTERKRGGVEDGKDSGTRVVY